MRGDKFALPIGMYLPHETERPVCRSARFKCNFLPFLSGSGERRQAAARISLAECGSEQPETVARNTATPKSAQTKSKERKSPCLKFLKVLKTSFKKFSSGVWDRVPRSYGSGQRPEVLGLMVWGRAPRSPTSKLFHSLWKSVWEKAKSSGKLLRDGGFRPVLRENGRKREEKSLWKNERLDFSARVMYNI